MSGRPAPSSARPGRGHDGGREGAGGVVNELLSSCSLRQAHRLATGPGLDDRPDHLLLPAHRQIYQGPGRNRSTSGHAATNRADNLTRPVAPRRFDRRLVFDLPTRTDASTLRLLNGAMAHETVLDDEERGTRSPE